MKMFPLLICCILLAMSCSKDSVWIKTRKSITSMDAIEDLSTLSDNTSNNPEGFLTPGARTMETAPFVMKLVDKEHPLPEDFEPEHLVNLNQYPELHLGKDSLFLTLSATEALIQLSRAADMDGITLWISSAYRSFSYQQALFNMYAEKDGTEEASRYSARPGTSQHQLGTAVDFGSISDAFAESDAGIWMAENAEKYGWSLSYPQGFEEETGYKWESWHWRWIGRDAVKMQNGYFGGIQQRLMVFRNENASLVQKALK